MQQGWGAQGLFPARETGPGGFCEPESCPARETGLLTAAMRNARDGARVAAVRGRKMRPPPKEGEVGQLHAICDRAAGEGAQGRVRLGCGREE